MSYIIKFNWSRIDFYFVQIGGSDAEYDEESELFEQECDVFMKDFVAEIFLIK